MIYHYVFNFYFLMITAIIYSIVFHVSVVFYVLLWKCIYIVLLSTFQPSFWFDSSNASCIWSINNLGDQWFANVFSHSTAWLFTLLMLLLSRNVSGYCNPICQFCLFLFLLIVFKLKLQECKISQRGIYTGVFKYFFL